jgi:hypothetical protein
VAAEWVDMKSLTHRMAGAWQTELVVRRLMCILKKRQNRQ